MEAGIPARLTPAEGRKFGLLVGAAFLALTALLWWRGAPAGMWVTGAIGALLVLGGLALPGHLGPIFRAWMGLAHLLSKVTTPIFMGIVYFVVLTPIGLLMRAFGRSPLPSPVRGASAWSPRPTARADGNQMFRQF
jgi:hypothetical protein